MHRVDDDARQPRRIEQAFFEIELPGAFLLRQEQPLQAIGEPRDDALQMRELLVEIAAQSLELLRLAQILGADGFVELAGIGLVVRAARLVALIARPRRLGRRFGIAHFGVVGHLGGRRIDGLRTAVGQFVGGRFRLRAHAFAVGRIGRFAAVALFVLLVFVIALFAFVLVGFARAVLAHVQAIEEGVDGVTGAALGGVYAVR